MNNNEGRYLEGRFMNERVLYYEYPQVRSGGRSTIMKRNVVRKLSDHEKVVNGEVVQIEDQPDE